MIIISRKRNVAYNVQLILHIFNQCSPMGTSWSHDSNCRILT